MLGYRRFLAIALTAATTVSVGIAIHRACEPESRFNPLRLVQRQTSVQTRDDAALLSGWLEKVDNGWEVGKNHQKVKSAFSEAIADARLATVRIFDQKLVPHRVSFSKMAHKIYKFRPKILKNQQFL